MPTYTIRVPEEHDPGSLAFLDAIEPGAGSHTLMHRTVYLGDTQVDVIKHSRLWVTIERTA